MACLKGPTLLKLAQAIKGRLKHSFISHRNKSNNKCIVTYY